MRDVPEPQLSPWKPPDYTVDGDGKVQGARPGEPNNWGRFGALDQRGCANLCTDDRVAAAAALIRTGKRFALGLPIGGITTPGYRAAPLHFMQLAAGDGVLGEPLGGGLQGSDDYMVLALQASTQLDALSHIGRDQYLYNGYWAGLVTTRSGARRLGIHHVADGIVGRAVLLDAGRHCGDGVLPGGFAIGPEQLDAACAAQRVEVRAGDILLVRTGWLGKVLDGGGTPPPGGEPGMSASAISWLAEHDVVMVATDTMTCEVMPFEDGVAPLSFHVGALRDLGMFIGELFDLDALADDCATDGTYECFFAAMPLPVVNGVGSPLNPVAIK